MTSNAVLVLRLVFLLLTLVILIGSIFTPGSEKWFALPAVALMSAGLFAPEVSMLHIPGIWFPFGVGVSRTQYAYVAFDVALVALLLHRLDSLAKRRGIELESVADEVTGDQDRAAV